MQAKSYIQNSLYELGLTEGEAATYLAILVEQGTEASYLKSKLGFSASGMYKILNTLVERGFIKSEPAEKPSKFTAASLKEIAKNLSSKGRKLQRVAEKFKSLDKLIATQSDTEIYEDTSLTDFYLNIPYKIDDEFMWCTGSWGAVKSFLGVEAEKDFINLRVKKGIHADAIIFDETDESRDMAGSSKSQKRESKFISGFNYPNEFTYLFGDTVVTFFKDDDGKVKIIKTDSPSVARARLLQYQMLWKSTE